MESLLHYVEPKFLIETVGLFGIIIIIFAESGLFFGFFLPGDSLLFTAGLFASQGNLPIVPLVIGSILAAILGDSVGYAFGKRVGPAIFTREDSFFFHKKHVRRAESFYIKYGAKTIILARFVPIVRTFAPIVAGVANMPYKTFLSWNIAGGFLWAGSLTILGYLLGNALPGIEKYLELVILGIIFVSFLPVAVEVVKEKRKRDAEKNIV
jgi:membrane-associated protein